MESGGEVEGGDGEVNERWEGGKKEKREEREGWE